VYPLLLPTFSLSHFVSAISAVDHSALQDELYLGVIFVVFAYAANYLQSKLGIILLTIGNTGQAVYREAHDHKFINK